jgi:PAS domain S-box-containing protein
MPRERGGPAGLIEYLWHGLGFGGSCFPKDVQALRKLGNRLGEPTPMLDAVLATNASQPSRLLALLEKEIDVAGQRIAVLGLAFKPGTDDLRESPAVPVVTALRKQGAHVIAHDPVAMTRAKRLTVFEGVSFASDWNAALKQADACLIITAWPEYEKIRPEDFRRLMRNPLVIDGRGLFDLEAMETAGVKWRGIGYLPDQSSSHIFENTRTQGTTTILGASLEQPNLFDLLHETIIIRDLTGRIIFWNKGAMEMYGWTHEEAIGNISHKLLKTRFPQELKYIERDFVEKGRWEGQLVHTKKNGNLIVVKSRWVLNYDSDSEEDSLLEINQISPSN